MKKQNELPIGFRIAFLWLISTLPLLKIFIKYFKKFVNIRWLVSGWWKPYQFIHVWLRRMETYLLFLLSAGLFIFHQIFLSICLKVSVFKFMIYLFSKKEHDCNCKKRICKQCISSLRLLINPLFHFLTV